jgi:phosphoribosylaminoimidazolecarboxamide formyltransferase/IMP cyclohydrolase
MLQELPIPVKTVSAYTGFPEILGGRVKTLHPKIHGGILARRDENEHLRQMAENDILPIDMVVINLYPFEQTAARREASPEQIIEMIDIGGPAMVRAAAKNHASVAVVTDACQYGAVLEEMNRAGSLSEETRRRLAAEAFRLTAHYDVCVANYFGSQETGDLFPPFYARNFEKWGDLRYGENPHQKAALYRDPTAASGQFIADRLLGGKEISFNNMLDTTAAVELVWEFNRAAVAVLKHTNPCGAALGDTLAGAYEKAYAGDPSSAFGGIVGMNRTLDTATAEGMAVPNTFFEVIVAPDFEEEAAEILRSRRWWGKTVRLLAYNPKPYHGGSDLIMKQIPGGLLLQERDATTLIESDLKVVSRRQPTGQEMESLKFAWAIVKHVKSNAIVLTQGEMLVGVGAGQMSRVDSSLIAVRKAGERAAGAVLASDAFFPFRDGLDVAAQAGVTAVIQPGGSKGDDEVVKAADEHGMAMLFTGMRHFRHL